MVTCGSSGVYVFVLVELRLLSLWRRVVVVAWCGFEGCFGWGEDLRCLYRSW